MAATRDRGRNQLPAMKMGGSIPPEWRDKIDTAARLVATGLWHSAGRPAVGERDEVRAGVIAAARKAIGEAPSGGMFSTAGALGVDPGEVAPDVRTVTPAGVFRLVIADFDRGSPTVAESIMVIIERATDAELARGVPGSS